MVDQIASVKNFILNSAQNPLTKNCSYISCRNAFRCFICKNFDTEHSINEVRNDSVRINLKLSKKNIFLSDSNLVLSCLRRNRYRKIILFRQRVNHQRIDYRYIALLNPPIMLRPGVVEAALRETVNIWWIQTKKFNELI